MKPYYHTKAAASRNARTRAEELGVSHIVIRIDSGDYVVAPRGSCSPHAAAAIVHAMFGEIVDEVVVLG